LPPHRARGRGRGAERDCLDAVHPRIAARFAIVERGTPF
jgi:hypothetical protein